MRVAVQMDPIETINIGGDSSFALMLEAQARGATLIHYLADDLSAENGRVRAKARPLKVINQAGAHYEWLGDPRTVDLADEADVVLMPPTCLSRSRTGCWWSMIPPRCATRRKNCSCCAFPI
jgi:glutathione synthase